MKSKSICTLCNNSCGNYLVLRRIAGSKNVAFRAYVVQKEYSGFFSCIIICEQTEECPWTADKNSMLASHQYLSMAEHLLIRLTKTFTRSFQVGATPLWIPSCTLPTAPRSELPSTTSLSGEPSNCGPKYLSVEDSSRRQRVNPVSRRTARVNPAAQRDGREKHFEKKETLISEQ